MYEYLDLRKLSIKKDSSEFRLPEFSPLGTSHLSTRGGGISGGTSQPLAITVPVSQKQLLTVEEQVVTLMLESMMVHIVKSWRVVQVVYPKEESMDQGGSAVFKKTKKGDKVSKASLLSGLLPPAPPPPPVWWNEPDEKVQVVFNNGNQYEGDISRRRLHGEGHFQWSTGTSYLGHFHFNSMQGRGQIEWKNLSTYEGEFLRNIRHGKGTFIDPIEGTSYIGDWYNGMKHGNGLLHYSYRNSYDGKWRENVRTGYGVREYDATSGYRGDWCNYAREGKGIMIWPNHDYYNGEWKDGRMNGYGYYIWSMQQMPSTLSQPSLSSYKGYWKKHMRNGFGIYRFGYSNGAHYKGQFHKNRKHGKGSLVTGDGKIIQNRSLFVRDNLAAFNDNSDASIQTENMMVYEPREIEMCCEDFDVTYHIEQSLRLVSCREMALENVLHKYMVINRDVTRASVVSKCSIKEKDKMLPSPTYSARRGSISNECLGLQKAVKCFEVDLKTIYSEYAVVCNSTDINFTPILYRLLLWQLYDDMQIHEKGLTLVQIDDMLYSNPAWIMKTRHDPFEKIYYWQFLHSLISVAIKLYYVDSNNKCDVAFRKFVLEDLIPGYQKFFNEPRTVCNEYVPLKGAYKLYQSIGEPHTVRSFMKAIRYPTHYSELESPTLYLVLDNEITCGKNTFTFDDLPAYIVEKTYFGDREVYTPEKHDDLKLYNLSPLPNKAIITNFARVFPDMVERECVLTVDTMLTFHEFYKVLFTCAEQCIEMKSESINITE